jgi:hypothetical protein
MAFLRDLSPGEWILLTGALAALPAAALGLRLFGLQRLLGWLDRPEGSRAFASMTDERLTAARLTRIVGAAARYGPWPANCLQRSLVLWWYLRSHGISGQLRIGVRRKIDGPGLDFHAWVEHAGGVLNDSPLVRSTFVTFDRAIVPSAARFS